MSDPSANLSGPPLHSTLHNQINDVIEAIEAELGINPSGADATVAALLAALPSRYAPISLGALGAHSLTTAFTTTGTHTTMQDEGLTKTVNDVIGFRYRFTLMVNPYTPGGSPNTITYQLLRDGVLVRNWDMPSTGASASTSAGITLMHTELIAATHAGSVYKVQMKGGSNTAVASYASATTPRQLLIENIGNV